MTPASSLLRFLLAVFLLSIRSPPPVHASKTFQEVHDLVKSHVVDQVFQKLRLEEIKQRMSKTVVDSPSPMDAR